MSLTQISDQLNEIDKLKSQAMELSEKKCRRLHMGVVPYFPGLALKAQTIVFWLMMYRRKLEAKIKMKVLRRWAKRINFQGSLAREGHSFEQIVSKIRVAQKLYEAIKKQAWE